MPDQRTTTTIRGVLLAPYGLIRRRTTGSASSRKRNLDATRYQELLDTVRSASSRKRNLDATRYQELLDTVRRNHQS